MVKVRINDVYDSFVKGNSMILVSSLGLGSFLSLIVLMIIGVLYYFALQQFWALIVFALITVGFVLLSVIHLISLPMLAKNDEYFGNLTMAEITLVEDSGLLVEGFDEQFRPVRRFTIYWDDINKINYNKHFIAIQCYGNEMLFIEKKQVRYLEGNHKTLEYYLRENVDRRAIKLDKWKKIVK